MIRSRLAALAAAAAMLLAAGCSTKPSSTSPEPSGISGPATSPTSGQQPKVLLGMYTELPGRTPAASLSLRENQLGRSLAIHHTFYDWTDAFPDATQTADKAHGRIPLITWWGVHYAEINDGSHDALIRARANAVRDYGGPVMLAWAAEMNLDFTPWSGPQNGNDPGAFIRAWRRIHDIFAAQGVRNVSWVWTPNAESSPGAFDLTSPNNWRHYYPGDAYVDWVGIDGYNWGNDIINKWRSLASFIGPIYRDYASRKPIMIAETACIQAGGDKAAWIDQARAWIKSHTGIRAFVWFDQRSSATHDWRIDSSPAALAAFKALSSDPVFGGGVR
jgi:hypothetical protein